MTSWPAALKPSTCTAESAVLTGRMYGIELLSNVINVKRMYDEIDNLDMCRCVAVPLALGVVKTIHD